MAEKHTEMLWVCSTGNVQNRGNCESNAPGLSTEHRKRNLSTIYYLLSMVLHGWGFVCLFGFFLQITFVRLVSLLLLVKTQVQRLTAWKPILQRQVVGGKESFIQEGGGIMSKDHLRSSRPSRRAFKSRKREAEFWGTERNLFLQSQIKLFHFRVLGISSCSQLPWRHSFILQNKFIDFPGDPEVISCLTKRQ